MVETEIRDLIQRELPRLIAEEPGIRDFILRTVSEYYTPRDEFSDRFDRILAELQRDREEQRLKWDEQNRKWEELRLEDNRKWEEQRLKWEEQNRKWDEQNRKWEELRMEDNRKWEELRLENDRKAEGHRLKWEEILQEIQKADRRYHSTIGALGARWGTSSEASFRNGLEAILSGSFGVEVLNLQEKDPEGEVFGRPDQVEIDVIIKNGLVIICELKSSISKAEMYIFDRKVAFYQKRYQRSVNRKIVISPMVDARALPVAEQLGIEVYSYADEVQA
jgi:hypothetical protein